MSVLVATLCPRVGMETRAQRKARRVAELGARMEECIARSRALFAAELAYMADQPHIMDTWTSAAGLDWGEETDEIGELDMRISADREAWGVTRDDMAGWREKLSGDMQALAELHKKRNAVMVAHAAQVEAIVGDLAQHK